MPNAIHERIQHAHAKLTVHLHVVGQRADGYHLLDAEMVSLDLADELTFDKGDSLEVRGSEAAHVPATADNLVARALRLAGTTAAVNLEKRIPAGGGLGGGSSDAAAALRWAGALDPVEASRIGADVPFCIRGGRARVGGIGEVLEPLVFEERTYTLIIPPFGVNTAAAFKVYDELGSGAGGGEGSDRNHLTAAAFVVEPRLKLWHKKIREWTGAEPVLAGSGATWFVEGAYAPPLEAEIEGGRWVVTNTTPPLQLD